MISGLIISESGHKQRHGHPIALEEELYEIEIVLKVMSFKMILKVPFLTIFFFSCREQEVQARSHQNHPLFSEEKILKTE